MSDRETAGWIVGGIFTFFSIITGSILYNNITITTITAEARVKVAETKVQIAKEINEGLTNLGRIWQ